MTGNQQQYEVEVKVLLGDPQRADRFLQKLSQHDSRLRLIAESNQLNHYFEQDREPNDIDRFVDDLIRPQDSESLRRITRESKSFTLRTRDENGRVSLVIKAAAEDEDDDHAVSRREGQFEVDADLETLDRRILEAGYRYLSKWSRHRREYHYKDYTVSVDRNAGYGYLAEIERVVTGPAAAARAKQKILSELSHLGFEELSQERLGRMFKHYNEHWQKYYKTSNTFVVA